MASKSEVHQLLSQCIFTIRDVMVVIVIPAAFTQIVGNVFHLFVVLWEDEHVLTSIIVFHIPVGPTFCRCFSQTSKS